jgi:hypothetical protein
MRHQSFFQLEAGMVGAEGDFHLAILAPRGA